MQLKLKIEAEFRFFSHAIKIRGEMSEIFECQFQIKSRFQPRIYLCRGVLADHRSGKRFSTSAKYKAFI